MSKIVAKRFPDTPGTTAVGGFIFLRVICPGIVSPESVDLELPHTFAPSRNARRALLLITKIIQVHLMLSTQFR